MFKGLTILIVAIIVIGITASLYIYMINGKLPSLQNLSPSNITQSIRSTKTPIGLPPHTFRVAITDSGFMPSVISIQKGDVIIWINQSKSDATVNSDPHPTHNLNSFLNLEKVSVEGSVQTKFENEGTFTYHNHLNPSQRGTAIVK